MESIEIDIKNADETGERDSKKKELGGAGKRQKQAQGDAHSSSRGERRSKQRFSPGRVPAEQRRSASAHNVKYNEGVGWVELMMMLMRMMRIKMMTAVLCFPLTLPPWSDYFHLQSRLLKYIQLSSADQRAPPRYVAPPLSHEIPASHCSALQQSRIHVHIVSSFVNRQLPGSAANPSHVPSNLYCTCSTYGSSDDTRVFCLSLIELHGPHNVTHTSDLNNKNKWWQILVIPSPLSVFNPLSLFQPQEPQLKAVLWVLLEVGQSGPSQMSHCSGCIYFLLTFCSHIPLFSPGAGLRGRQSKEKKKKTQCHE